MGRMSMDWGSSGLGFEGERVARKVPSLTHTIQNHSSVADS